MLQCMHCAVEFEVCFVKSSVDAVDSAGQLKYQFTIFIYLFL